MVICVVGMGYVGYSHAALLAQSHTVWALEVDDEKLAQLESGACPIDDPSAVAYSRNHKLDLRVARCPREAYAASQMAIVAVPTDYDANSGFFDTSVVSQVVEEALDANSDLAVVIKSTVPIGFTDELAAKHPGACIFCSPEFLREGSALSDAQSPSRLIAGIPGTAAQDQRVAQAVQDYLDLSREFAVGQTPVRVMSAAAAEAVKLFSNTYLALRVAFFNELDTFAEVHGLDALEIIEGVSLDGRIGNYYNNPSFGYGGYCLPKDAKQLLANYQGVPQDIVGATVAANATRKDHIVRMVLDRVQALEHQLGRTPVVGIYRLSMKRDGSIRFSSVVDVASSLAAQGVDLVVFEPNCENDTSSPWELEQDLTRFLQRSDLVVANRWSEDLRSAEQCVYTRDLFFRD